jgi:outer membrane protein assembly factor BamB
MVALDAKGSRVQWTFCGSGTSVVTGSDALVLDATDEVVLLGTRAVYALDAETGEQRFGAGGFLSVRGPVIAGDVAVLREDGVTSDVIGVDVKTGETRWHRPAGGGLVPAAGSFSPAVLTDDAVISIANGVTVLPAGPGGPPAAVSQVQSVDRATGAVRWTADLSFPGGGMLDPSRAAVAGGTVVVIGMGPAGTTPIALSEEDGRERWRVSPKPDLTDFVGGGNVLVGFHTDQSGTTATALSPADGTVLWTREGAQPPVEASAEGLVYLSDDDARLLAVDAKTGDERWSAGNVASATLSGPLLYTIGSGTVTVRDAASGHANSSHTLDLVPPAEAVSAGGNGRTVFVAVGAVMHNAD